MECENLPADILHLLLDHAVCVDGLFACDAGSGAASSRRLFGAIRLVCRAWYAHMRSALLRSTAVSALCRTMCHIGYAVELQTGMWALRALTKKSSALGSWSRGRYICGKCLGRADGVQQCACVWTRPRRVASFPRREPSAAIPNRWHEHG